MIKKVNNFKLTYIGSSYADLLIRGQFCKKPIYKSKLLAFSGAKA